MSMSRFFTRKYQVVLVKRPEWQPSGEIMVLVPSLSNNIFFLPHLGSQAVLSKEDKNTLDDTLKALFIMNHRSTSRIPDSVEVAVPESALRKVHWVSVTFKLPSDALETLRMTSHSYKAHVLGCSTCGLFKPLEPLLREELYGLIKKNMDVESLVCVIRVPTPMQVLDPGCVLAYRGFGRYLKVLNWDKMPLGHLAIIAEKDWTIIKNVYN